MFVLGLTKLRFNCEKGKVINEIEKAAQSLITQLQTEKFADEQREELLRKYLRQHLKSFKINGRAVISRILEMISEMPRGERADFIRSCLINYQKIYCRFVPKEPLAPGLDLLEISIRKELTLALNRSRGKGYEEGLGNWVVRNALSRNYPNQVFDCEIDRHVFQIEDAQGQIVTRRADIFIRDLLIIVEIKSGRICLDKHIRSQIEKDKYLLARNIVKDVYWILFRGASASVLDHLDSANIAFLDFSYE
jgi:hypothetical protein